ncbi:putative membrane-associated, metal-dependent hydrolase [Desulfocapsa sulfexigens DSM 10523]|uniref:Putative membrane-associated, metal-dependent hydrolase n=1 Tax=Desulfocapsa sulfexigens (strain DSM 10523 / SB164P1) TaxID=1167006 RepID=M1PE26_DESSD|nr:phosphoethanolamine--lipid A transferase [Desulfocapsa sulfexigens]AGF77950.1 putative membrane-associated, metal-dependent hydrolase [Desulfocapsa sulfexigens DSM 10523]
MRVFKGVFGIYSGKKEVSATKLIISTALFFVLFGNIAFFQHVFSIYPISFQNIGFLGSLAVGLTAILTLFLTLITSRYTIKPTLVILLIISSFTAYFMDNYNVVIDDIMIQSILETDLSETSDLASWRVLSYLLLLGVLPSLLVQRVKLVSLPLKKTVLYKARDCVVSILILTVMIFSFSKFYTSFFREHKPLRYYTNPSYYLYSIGKYAADILSPQETGVMPLGKDAQVVKRHGEERNDRKELVILVVGEAVRADHFSLNGYERETNPLLAQEKIVNFSEMYSCGTSTAYSVPCMFSHYNRKDYSPRKGRTNENILDVLNHTDAIDVLWRDNNSDSKGVALRVPYEDYSKPENNSVCSDGECRDEGMLAGLDHYIDQHPGRDILIVLHQMGNHGPAYYKRYPEEFEKFQPVCRTNQLEECTQQEIVNAYDNTLLYTDYFLSKVIGLLKGYDKSHNTAMLYFSDHGESLGEKGLYLHGMPYAVAPEAQTHIGSLMWFGDEIREKIDVEKVKKHKDQRYSHDNLFHTLLGIFEVETGVYNNELDILYNPSFGLDLIGGNIRTMSK